MMMLILGMSFSISSTLLAQNESTLVNTAKTFLNLMEQGKYHNAYLMFDSSVMKLIPEQKNTEGWELVHKKIGNLKKQTKTRVEQIKPYTAVFLTCEFEHASLDVKVVFKDGPRIFGYFLVPTTNYAPPPYADTNAVIERKVEVKTGSYTLSAIVTEPKKGSHFPIAVLVHGSGPHDKDEGIGNNKPFKDIALGLASKGIATLRYDKRTFVYGAKSAADPASITLKEETIDDAVSALKLAQTFPEIDQKKIYLLGHSQGASSAPRIARETPFIAGIIMMAGNARSFEDVIADQMAYLLPMQVSKKQSDSLLAITSTQVEQIRKRKFTDTTSHLLLGLSGIYWKDMKNYDQIAAAKSLKMPMLILQGEKDYQVSMKDFNLWKSSLALNKQAEFISYPGLTHLFMPGEGKPSDYEKANHISEKVISDIAAWIKK
jgi:fermentation-respiration switch protein FrsA (DUF1100 family)